MQKRTLASALPKIALLLAVLAAGFLIGRALPSAEGSPGWASEPTMTRAVADALLWPVAPKPVHRAVVAPKPVLRPTAPHSAPAGAKAGTGKATYFSGYRGASGARLVGMFAAHLTAPFFSKWKISAGGRSVVVTVLDRGPAAWTGKTWDLAPAAFAQLAPLSRGVVTVTYRRVG